MKKGIDISYCQKGLDLTKAKAEGVEYVIIRAGISTRTDTEFVAHTKGATKAGLPYGFYWYSRAFSTADAKKEAEACLKAIKPYAPTYPIYYDMEEKDQIAELDKATRTAIITTFCDAIKAAGYTPGVYLNPSWMETYVDKAQIVGKYDIWLAHWTENPNKPSKYDYGQKMWQWGLDRICGKGVDGDICFYDYEQPKETITTVPTSADSNKIYRSLGIAAKRKGASTTSDLADRCERGGYYTASQIVTASNGQQWLRHAGTGLYSALTDNYGAGPALFEECGTYTTGVTNAPVNVRVGAGLDKQKITLLEVGVTVYLTGKTAEASDTTWIEVIYDGRLAWMAKVWIDC